MANLTAAAQYADLVAPAAAALGIPVGLANGLIDYETGGTWDPASYRNEPAIQDGSRGLTQILYRTAVEVGYLGTPDGLFDPYVNVPLGLRYLANQYARAGSWPGALSAYNGGWYPAQGFGQVLTAPRTVVLARDQVTGQPVQTRNAPAGEYANQPYVDAVLGRAAEFGYGAGDGLQTSAVGWILGAGLVGAVVAKAQGLW